MPSTFSTLSTIILSALASAAIALAQSPEPSRTTADRTRELLRLDCVSRSSERDVTLFANGTLRLREGRPGGDRRLDLIELTENELEGYRARLEPESFEDRGAVVDGQVSGEWVEQCRLRLDFGAGTVDEYRFAPLEALPLHLAQRVAVAEELLALARSRRGIAGFPPDYRPRPGDVVARDDGSRFRIVRFTGDGRGVEIVGIDQPLLLYLEAAAVRGEFRALLERGRE